MGYRETELQIPEERWYHLIDRLTRIDELLETLIRLTGILNNNIAIIAQYMGATMLPSPQAPTPGIPEVVEREVRLTGPVAVQQQAIEKLSSSRISIPDGSIHRYEISGDTDIIKIFVEEGGVQYDVRSVTDDSDKVPPGSTLIWRIPRGRYNRLYLRGASGNGTPSTVYVSEWRYVQL